MVMCVLGVFRKLSSFIFLPNVVNVDFYVQLQAITFRFQSLIIVTARISLHVGNLVSLFLVPVVPHLAYQCAAIVFLLQSISLRPHRIASFEQLSIA